MAKDRPDTKKPPTMMIGSILEAGAICEQLARGEMMDKKLTSVDPPGVASFADR